MVCGESLFHHSWGPSGVSRRHSWSGRWLFPLSFPFRTLINNSPTPAVSMAPAPFSLPSFFPRKLLMTSRVKEPVNKWQRKTVEGRKHYLSIRQVSSVLNNHSNSRTTVKVTLSAFTHHIERTRNAWGALSEVWMGIQSPCSSSLCLFWGLFFCLKWILYFKLVTMSGATSDQLHRSTLTVYVVSFYRLYSLCFWCLFMKCSQYMESTYTETFTLPSAWWTWLNIWIYQNFRLWFVWMSVFVLL